MIFHSIPASVGAALLESLLGLPGQCHIDDVAALVLCLKVQAPAAHCKVSAELLASALDQVERLRRPGFALNQLVSLLKGCLKTPAEEVEGGI